MFNLTFDEGAYERGFTLLSSSMRVNGPSYPTSAQVCELAALAWYEMGDKLRTDDKHSITNRSKPRALTILQWRDQLHVSSSVKGGGDTSWIDQTLPTNEPFTLLRKALQESGIDPPASHRNQASCGEMLALHQWAVRSCAGTFRNLGSGSEYLLVTVGEEGRGQEKTLTVKRPCYGQPRGGCEQVLAHLGLSFLYACEEPSIHQETRMINLVDHSHWGIFG